MFSFLKFSSIIAVAAQAWVSALAIEDTPPDPLPPAHLSARDAPGRTTTLKFGKDVGSFVAVQNPAFKTLNHPLATTTRIAATQNGVVTTLSLPLIVGPGGWVWSPLPYP